MLITKNEIRIGCTALAEFRNRGLVDRDLAALDLVLPVLLERLAVRADILELCTVYHVKRYHQIGVAAGRGVRVKINRARNHFVHRRGIYHAQRAGKGRTLIGYECNRISALLFLASVSLSRRIVPFVAL